MTSAISRAGRFVKQPTGYRAFIPADLPPDPPIDLDASLMASLSRADQAIGRLDGSTIALPNADLFVAMYVRKEAVLSSQIEGTQSSLDDVLAFELDPHEREIPQDVTEVVNYIRAMNFGISRLETLPLSLRLIDPGSPSGCEWPEIARSPFPLSHGQHQICRGTSGHVIRHGQQACAAI